MVDPSSEPDALRNARGNFDTQANAALLAALSNNAADPLSYLAGQGYTVGVGHEPGSKPQGRAEYWGLLDPKGNFVQGQADPTMTTSDSWFDLIAPFALMAPAVAGVIGAGGAAAGAGAGAGGTAGTAGTLGASYIPTAVESMAGLLPLEGGLSAAASALPEFATLGGLGGTGTLASLVPTAVESMSGLPALTGGLGEAAAALPEFGTLNSIGAGSAWADSALQSLGNAASGSSSAVKDALYGDAGYGQGMTGAQTGAYDAVLNATGSKGLADLAASTSIGSSLVNGAQSLANLVGGAGNLGSIVGGLLGAADSKDGVQTQSRDPWGPAQGYLKNLLGDAEALRKQRAATPFSARQTQAYDNAFGLADQAQAALPGLLDFAQQMQGGGFNWQRGQSAIPGQTGAGLLTPTRRALPANTNFG